MTSRVQQTALHLGSPENINAYIRARWVVVPDPPEAEFVMSPDLQLCQEMQNGYLYGDCDDSATLAASLLFTLGYPCWFVAGRLPGETEFSHVWTRTHQNGYGSHGNYLDIDPIVNESQLPLHFESTLQLTV